jgi:type I restriction enzyme, S subunit
MSDQLNRWATRPLGELCDVSRGITYGIVKVGNFVPDGIPVIRGGDIRDNRVVHDNEKRVSREVSDQFKRTLLRGGEIVLNLIAEPGHCAVVPASMAGCNVSRDVAVIPLLECVDHTFVNYFLKSPVAIRWLNARLQGSVTQKINLGTLREIPVPIPPRPVQEAIASVLGALDHKVEVNTRLIRLCDELWFGELTRVLNGWDLEGAVLPSGWSRTSLSSLARFVNGRNFTKDATGSGRMVVRIAELNSGPGGATVYNDIQVPVDHVVAPGDLLFAWSGSLTVQRWYRPEAIVNQHIFKVVPLSGIPKWLVHGYLLQLLPWYRQVAADKATTMGHIQRRHLEEEVVFPDPATRSRLDERCSALWERALAAERESLALARLRDTLLPRLLSGELRVRDAEELVGEAV